MQYIYIHLMQPIKGLLNLEIFKLNAGKHHLSDYIDILILFFRELQKFLIEQVKISLDAYG